MRKLSDRCCRKTLAFGFEKATYPFVSRAAALFAQGVLPRTSKPVFCRAPNLSAPRISLLSFDPMQTEQSLSDYVQFRTILHVLQTAQFRHHRSLYHHNIFIK